MIYTAERITDNDVVMTAALLLYQLIEERGHQFKQRRSDLRDRLSDLSRRLRDEGYDGEDDPRDPLKAEIDTLTVEIETCSNQLQLIMDKTFTADELHTHLCLVADLEEAAADRAADRRVRAAECGNYEAVAPLHEDD